MITTNRKKITKKIKIAGVFEIRLCDMLYHLPDKFVLFVLFLLQWRMKFMTQVGILNI